MPVHVLRIIFKSLQKRKEKNSEMNVESKGKTGEGLKKEKKKSSLGGVVCGRTNSTVLPTSIVKPFYRHRLPRLQRTRCELFPSSTVVATVSCTVVGCSVGITQWSFVLSDSLLTWMKMVLCGAWSASRGRNDLFRYKFLKIWIPFRISPVRLVKWSSFRANLLT